MPKPKSEAEPTKVTPREVSRVARLVSRWRWLEADRDYHAEIAETDEASEAARVTDRIEQACARARAHGRGKFLRADTVPIFDFEADEAARRYHASYCFLVRLQESNYSSKHLIFNMCLQCGKNLYQQMYQRIFALVGFHSRSGADYGARYSGRGSATP